MRALPEHWCAGAVVSAPRPANSPMRLLEKCVLRPPPPTPSTPKTSADRRARPEFAARHPAATIATRPPTRPVVGDTPLLWPRSVLLPISRATLDPPRRSAPAGIGPTDFFQCPFSSGPGATPAFQANDIVPRGFSVRRTPPR